MFLQETNLSGGAQLCVLTHLPIPKVIFTSSAGCIMYDRVNQLETKRGESNLARTACPLQASPHPSSSFIEAFSPSTDIFALSSPSLYLTPAFNSASLLYKLSSLPKTMSWLKGEPLVAISLDVLLQPQIICIVSVNYSPHSSSCRARDIPVCLRLRGGLGGWYSSSLDHIVLCCFSGPHLF